MGLSLYYKNISYIDLYEREEKIKNIGFVKVEVRDDNWKIKVNMQGVPILEKVMCEMKTLESQEYIDRFEIKNGKCDFEKKYNMTQVSDFRNSIYNGQGLLFQLSSHKYGKCVWKTSYMETHKEVLQEGLKEKISKENELPEKGEQTNPVMHIAENNPEDKCEKNIKEKYEKELKIPNNANIGLPNCQFNTIEIDKWKQLGRMYPAIHPFHEGEKGEYISIKPKDFVILQEKYQVLVNNSFLLHGFFNYQHIILGKIVEEGKVKYYIGVPGTFHEKEKMIAIMFGFERFLGVESEDRGAFGYYMKEVKI